MIFVKGLASIPVSVMLSHVVCPPPHMHIYFCLCLVLGHTSSSSERSSVLWVRLHRVGTTSPVHELISGEFHLEISVFAVDSRYSFWFEWLVVMDVLFLSVRNWSIKWSNLYLELFIVLFYSFDGYGDFRNSCFIIFWNKLLLCSLGLNLWSCLLLKC